MSADGRVGGGWTAELTDGRWLALASNKARASSFIDEANSRLAHGEVPLISVSK